MPGMMSGNRVYIEDQIKRLQSKKASDRYDACENLRVTPDLTPEAIISLQNALNDPDAGVADVAKSALDAHKPSEISKSAENVNQTYVVESTSGIKTNKIAVALQAIAKITYIFGFGSGVIFGMIGESLFVVLIFWMSAFISGTLFLGFAEIINLLQKLVDLGAQDQNTP